MAMHIYLVTEQHSLDQCKAVSELGAKAQARARSLTMHLYLGQGRPAWWML